MAVAAPRIPIADDPARLRGQSRVHCILLLSHIPSQAAFRSASTTVIGLGIGGVVTGARGGLMVRFGP
jgi:hypothetical protein